MINKCLAIAGMEQYYSLFSQQNIIDKTFLEINQHKQLQGLGITSFLHRKRILKTIEVMNNRIYLASEDDRKLQKQILERFPYPIAYAYFQMITEANDFIRLQLLKDLTSIILRYSTMLALSTYLWSDKKNSQLEKMVCETIRKPQFGHWQTLISNLITLTMEGDSKPGIPEFIEFYSKVESGKGKKTKKYNIEVYFTGDDGDQKVMKKQMTAISALINFRNKYIGHHQTMSLEKSREIYGIYFPIIFDILRKMQFVIDYPIISIQNKQSLHWMGRHATPVETPKNDAGIYLKKEQDLLLLPSFFIQVGKDNNELFLYEHMDSERVTFSSAVGNFISLDLVNFNDQLIGDE